MIVKIPMVLALVIYIKDVSSASFTKVFVQHGPDLTKPVENFKYGAPSVSYSPQIAQLTTVPVGSVVPYSSNYVPCGTPCVYPSQVSSIVPNANMVQYQPPSSPVVVAPSISESSGYEYGYVVYDEQTGDYKVQREQSDGSLVQGGYSFLQPDGFIREVQYIADDSQGFNAVVKNYLPVAKEPKEHGDTETSKPVPCHETKNGNLKTDEIQPVIIEKENNYEIHNAKHSHENLKANGHKEHSFHVQVEELEHPQAEHQEVHKEWHEKYGKGKVDPLKENYEAVEQQEHKDHTILPPNTDESTAQEELLAEGFVVGEEPQPSIEQDVFDFIENVVAVAEQKIENSNILVPYNGIIWCVQNAINKANEMASTHKPESPLTYIILNKPC